jgi:heme oxygenase
MASRLVAVAIAAVGANAFTHGSLAPSRVSANKFTHGSLAPSGVSPRARVLLSEQSTAAPPAPTARASGLALLLDDGTRKSHSMAENTAFVTGFFRGIGTREAFGQLVTSLWFVYEAMEEEFANAQEQNVRSLDFAELHRTDSLRRDMAFWHGEGWETRVRPSPATRLYVARVREIARTQPKLLVGHMYTRYLGDLFGGQMMGGMASHSLGLPNGEGTAFYSFEQIGDVKAFIERWYAELNALPISSDEREAIVDEANRVFSLNIALFDELEGSPLRAMWALAVRALAEWDRQFEASWLSSARG